MTGWCSWCKEPTTEPVLINIVAANSGPGGSVNACPDCVESRQLRPLLYEDTDPRPRPRPGNQPERAQEGT